MRVVYDVSERENSKSLSLNDCLEAHPALQNLPWSILIRIRFKLLALYCDLQKVCLQMQIKKEDRDVLKHYWVRTEDLNEIKVLRLVFGLVQSPFILEETIEKLSSYTEKNTLLKFLTLGMICMLTIWLLLVKISHK